MRLDQCGNLAASRDQKGGGTDAALPAWQSASNMTHNQPQKRQAGHVHRVGVGPEGDVVAEERREFVGVGVTTDPPDQIGVVHSRSLLQVEAHPLGDPCRDQGRPKHVFHRLTQTEVDRQRYRGQQFGSAQTLCRAGQRPVRVHFPIVHLNNGHVGAKDETTGLMTPTGPSAHIVGRLHAVAAADSGAGTWSRWRPGCRRIRCRARGRGTVTAGGDVAVAAAAEAACVFLTLGAALTCFKKLIKAKPAT